MQKDVISTDSCDARVIHFEKVKAAKDAALDDDDLSSLSIFFKTFADPSRLKILMALSQLEMCVCDIAAFLDISESAVSHQLRFLRNSRLVKSRREGTALYYRLSDDHVQQVIATGLDHVLE
jgi:DNA-binding transcriptional ArsR family regulator